jgi:hypothetical protein
MNCVTGPGFVKAPPQLLLSRYIIYRTQPRSLHHRTCNRCATTKPNMAFSFQIQNECLMDAMFDLSNANTILENQAAEVYIKCCQANVTFTHQSNITLQITVRSKQELVLFLKNASLYTMWHRPKNNTSL